MIRDEPFDEDALKDEFGVDSCWRDKWIRGKKGPSSGATCNIAGLISGYVGDGAKTVLPNHATAKIDFRLIPGMDPQRQAARLVRHLELNGFDDIEVKVFHSVGAARTNPSDPFV